MGIFYLVLVLVQGQGVVGVSFGEQTECEDARAELLKQPDVVGISACMGIRVEPTARGIQAS